MKSRFVERSTMVSMAWLWGSTIKSISKSPKRFPPAARDASECTFCRNGETLVFGSAPIFEFVTGLARQFSACIGMDCCRCIDVTHWHLPSSIRPIFVAVTTVLRWWVVWFSTPIREQGQHCVWNACDVPSPWHAPWTKCTYPTGCCCVSIHEKAWIGWCPRYVRSLFLGIFFAARQRFATFAPRLVVYTYAIQR